MTTIHESSVSPAILLAGDFNLPDLSYVDQNPTYGYETNSLFVEIMNNYGFEQFVTQPTREGHVLDLVLSTNPGIIENVQVVPRISDHEDITCQLVLSTEKPVANSLQRVYQYHRADMRGTYNWGIKQFYNQWRIQATMIAWAIYNCVWASFDP